MATQSPSGSQTRPLNVIIVGGSCAGLFAGILLKRRGHNVHILEQAASSKRSGLAAGVGLSLRVKGFFETEDRLNDIPMGVPNENMLVLKPNLEVNYKIPIQYNMTTWDTAYYRLRANFDGLKSDYCPEPPPFNSNGKEGEGFYDTGKQVVKVEDSGGQMVVVTENTVSGNTERHHADIVIAADGANSNVRRQLNPKLQREEPGYVIWRGTVQTSEISQSTLDRLEGKAIIYPGYRTYCIIYTIPGDDGSLKPGFRHLNFAWYFWPSEPSLREIMTDVDGHHHRTTIPKGKLRPEIWEAQIVQARRVFPPPFLEVIEKIHEPFVSVISSIASPRASYFDNRLFLIGDALVQTQPNAGMGTNIAALGAITLVDAIGSPSSGSLDQAKISKWEEELLEYAQLTRLRSVAFASWFLNGWLSMGWYYARFYATMWFQRWFGRRRAAYILFQT